MVVLLLLLLLPPFAAAQPWPVCGTYGNYTAGSTYAANLKLLSDSIPKNVSSSTSLFATGTAGKASDTVYSLALCRGDVSAPTCADCVATGFQVVQQLCQLNRDAGVYYDACLLQYSSMDFLASAGNGRVYVVMNNENLTAESLRLAMFTLVSVTAESAASSARRFTTAFLSVDSVPNLYCLMQCTPDLTAGECAACFKDFTQLTLQHLVERQGGRIIGLRCNMRFETYPFYLGDATLRITSLAPSVPAVNTTDPGTQVSVYPMPPAGAGQLGSPPAPVVATTDPVRQQNNHGRKIIVAGSIAGTISFLLLVVAAFILYFQGKKQRSKIASNSGKANLQHKSGKNSLEEDAFAWKLQEKGSDFSVFELNQVLVATENFTEGNRLGQGGFGPVYKGRLTDGQEVAVKRLASHSGQGFMEFKNEVELIAKLQHTNLVRLLGCCIQQDEKILVYEYLPNKSLDFFIFNENKSSLLDWNKRRAIVEGIAQGLLYLHKHSRLRVVHRDLKASNILLDQDMNPKISDFGLAKIFSSNDTKGNTKRVAGTYGYMSPEYACEGIYSIKSDVFSFGVLFLEILSGKRNSAGFHRYGDFLNLLGHAWFLWEEGRWLELVEASMATEVHIADAKKYINIALMCVQENADDRPTMSDVVAMLNSENVVLPEPKHPAYFSLKVSKQAAGESTASVEPSRGEPCSINYVTITYVADGR